MSLFVVIHILKPQLLKNLTPEAKNFKKIFCRRNFRLKMEHKPFQVKVEHYLSSANLVNLIHSSPIFREHRSLTARRYRDTGTSRSQCREYRRHRCRRSEWFRVRVGKNPSPKGIMHGKFIISANSRHRRNDMPNRKRASDPTKSWCRSSLYVIDEVACEARVSD